MISVCRRFWNQILWPSIDYRDCFEQTCWQSRAGPAAAGPQPARTFRYHDTSMHHDGPQGTRLPRVPARTQSCASTRTEPSRHSRRATPARAQSHASTRAEPASEPHQHCTGTSSCTDPRLHAHRDALALAIELCISTRAIISKLKKYQSWLKGK